MSDVNHLRTVVRRCVAHLDTGGPDLAAGVIERLRAAGAERNIHVGKTMVGGSTECVEWYAGQILDVLESEKWFAVNSIINCLDKFCPEQAP